MAFLLQLLPPLLLCFPVLLLTHRLRCAQKLPFGREAATAVFLGAQLALLYLARLAPASGLVLMLALLGAFGLAVRKSQTAPTPWRGIAAALFSAYLVYWLIEKYLIPWGLTGSAMFDISWLHTLYQGAKGLAIVGISFMGFKLIHFFLDWRSGDIDKPSPGEFLAWLFFFPSIIAGPIQRFQDWQEQRALPAPAWIGADRLAEGLQRIITGLFLKFVLGDTIYGLSIEAMNVEVLSSASWAELALAAACYSLYLYWDFSGYSHIAIGTALFWGIRLPENFNHPFVARNLAEFWNRWHITFSELLRDYIFYPLSMAIRRKPWSRGYPVLAVCIPPIVTFLLAGIWHGAALGFVFYGLIHGVGLAVVALLKRRKAATRFGIWWQQSRAGHVGGAAITFAYVSFSFIFFCLPSQSLAVLGKRLLQVW